MAFISHYNLIIEARLRLITIQVDAAVSAISN